MMFLVEIGGLRVVISPRGEDIVALAHAGTAVNLRRKITHDFINDFLYFSHDRSSMEAFFDNSINSDQLL